MPAILTYHPSSGSPVYGTGHAMPVRPRMVGNNESLTISGTAANGAAVSSPSICRVFAEEDCWVASGAGMVATASNGVPFAAGESDDFALAAGERISVISR